VLTALQELVISCFHGVGLVPRSAARIRLPNLAFTEIAGLAPDIVETHGVWRGEHNNPALDSLLRLTEAAA
jgi:hypothetical protein